LFFKTKFGLYVGSRREGDKSDSWVNGNQNKKKKLRKLNNT